MTLRDYWTQSASIKSEQTKPTPVVGNPMVVLHGSGPEGKQCKDCKYLVGICYAKTVYKCQQRTDLTHGKRSDQKVRYPACSFFEQRTGDMNLYDGR